MATSTAPVRRPAAHSTVGLKIMMALTGILFVLFVLFHMYGNLKILQSTEAFDEYAHHLRTFLTPILPYEGLLWILRVVLLAAVITHAYAAYTLWAKAQKARGQAYGVKKAIAASFASKMMRWGGTALLLFIIFHILHFTTLTVKTYDDGLHPSGRLIESFEHWWVWLIYLIAIFALCMHIFHGVWSAITTLGYNRASTQKRDKTISAAIAILVFLGFMLPPTLILLDQINI